MNHGIVSALSHAPNADSARESQVGRFDKIERQPAQDSLITTTYFYLDAREQPASAFQRTCRFPRARSSDLVSLEVLSPAAIVKNPQKR
ncbi:MAG: hypothetical protein DWH78_06490 [Planctomycetota bacterium]|nr:MAG: hypothetical protein DWH78_06490 [Planctomycetota bacterium]